MLKTTIANWIESKKFFPVEISDAFSLFLKETKIDVSRSYFFQIFSEYTKAQVIKTGGIFTRSSDIIETIVQRSFFGVTMNNTYAIDEKPIIIENYKSKKVRISKNYKGKVPANLISTYKMLDHLKNVYLICCISCNSVVQYHLSECPINTLIFNAFMHQLCSNIKPSEYGRFILLDNASFHGLDGIVIDEMEKNKLEITRTPPLGCLFNPIEEFFACFDDILKKNIKLYIQQNGQLNQNEFLKLIHISISETTNMDMQQIFRRAGILEE